MLKQSQKIFSNKKAFKYYIYYPSNIQKNMPVLVFLHGISELGAIEKYALPKYMNKFDIPYIVIAARCHKNNSCDYHLRDVEKVLEFEYKRFEFYKNNIFVLDSSMGAYGAWNYLIQRPELSQ